MLFDAIHIRAMGVKGTRDSFVLPQRMRKRASLVSARHFFFHVATKLGTHKTFLFFLFGNFDVAKLNVFLFRESMVFVTIGNKTKFLLKAERRVPFFNGVCKPTHGLVALVTAGAEARFDGKRRHVLWQLLGLLSDKGVSLRIVRVGCAKNGHGWRHQHLKCFAALGSARRQAHHVGKKKSAVKRKHVWDVLIFTGF